MKLGRTDSSTESFSHQLVVRIYFTCVLCVFWIAESCGRWEHRDERQPNILLIVADDLGYGDLGCYGQASILTPNIDRLAEEGTRFTNVYGGGSVSASSRCTLMTGLHTGHARIRGIPPNSLLDDDVTVAEVLKEAGYTTGLIGKWGLGGTGLEGNPNRHGFDHFFGYMTLRDAFDYYPEFLWRNETKVILEGNAKGGRSEYSHDLLTREALEFIGTNRDRPFFLYLAYTIPHADPGSQEDGLPVPSDAPYSDRPWPQAQKNYAAMVTRLDRDIGAIMDRLEELDLAEPTYVFFTSDHGPHNQGGFDPEFFKSAGPLRGMKFTPYEGGIRVPMIARRPGTVPAGRVSDAVWTFWDFLPTAAAIAGVGAPPGIDGVSVLPALVGGHVPEPRFLYWEFHERGFVQAVRMGRWKAIRRGLGGEIELYDLESDPGEQENVAAKNGEVVEKIEAYLRTARSESEHWRPRGPSRRSR